MHDMQHMFKKLYLKGICSQSMRKRLTDMLFCSKCPHNNYLKEGLKNRIPLWLLICLYA